MIYGICFSSGTGSLGGPGKRVVKWLWCGGAYLTQLIAEKWMQAQSTAISVSQIKQIQSTLMSQVRDQLPVPMRSAFQSKIIG